MVTISNQKIRRDTLEIIEISNGYALYGKDPKNKNVFIAHVGDGVDGLPNLDDPDLPEAYQFEWVPNLTIYTNHHRYPVLDWNQLTEKEQANFDHHRTPDDGTSYVRYRDWVYDLDDMERSNIEGWDNQMCDTFFSGVLFRYPREEWGEIDYDHVICGTFIG